MGAIEFGAHVRPFLSGGRMLAVYTEVRSACGIAVCVSVLVHPLEHLGWRVIPEVALVEVFAGRRVGTAASLVGLADREAGALPFLQQPLLKPKAVNAGFVDVLNAPLRDYRKPPNLSCVDISCDVPFSLVPDIRIYVTPAVPFKNRMHRSPSDFRVPKPKGRRRGGSFGPRSNMWLIPFWQTQMVRGVAFKTEYAVTAIRDNNRWGFPLRVMFKAVAKLHRD